MGRRSVDLARARAALARLDALVLAHPELLSEDYRRRLAESLRPRGRVLGRRPWSARR